MFRIWCEVWGGVTDWRASWLKSNGVVAEYARGSRGRSGAAQSQDGRQLVFHDKLSLQREAMIS
jgi:hypothetical protein